MICESGKSIKNSCQFFLAAIFLSVATHDSKFLPLRISYRTLLCMNGKLNNRKRLLNKNLGGCNNIYILPFFVLYMDLYVFFVTKK